MIRIITYVSMLILLCSIQSLSAQSEQDSLSYNSKKYKLEELNEEKDQIVIGEKEKLKTIVKEINEKLDKGEITAEEAQNQKEEAAKKIALNIENKTAIVDNKIELVKRGEDYNFEYDQASWIGIGIGNAYDERGSTLLGIHYENNSKKAKVNRKTNSDIFFAFGLNNALIDGQSLEDTPYKIGGSKFFELGWLWSTRLSGENNFLRLRYGFSFQFNGFNIKDNMHYVDAGDETVLEEFPQNLKKSKFRTDNLVFPVFFEFGPDNKKRKNNEKTGWYSSNRGFKLGLGGYAGFNMSARQKLKFDRDGDKVKQKIKDDFNVNDFVYGLSAYIGDGDCSFYVKYDLNPIFDSPNMEQNNISLGLRIDM